MEYTQKEVKNAVLTLADFMELKTNYTAIEESKSQSLPGLLNMLIYDMFVKGIEASQVKDQVIQSAMLIIKTYCLELHKNGFVEFNKIQ